MPLLPPIPGPKLHPFSTQSVNIDFLRELGKGMDSIVFKASLNGSIYALKIFKRPSKSLSKLRHGLEAKPREALYWTAPFYSECRACGRLKELRLEHLAVKCYGYIQLSEKHLDELKEQCSYPFWEVRPQAVPDEPVWAIVKELIEIRPCSIEISQVRHMSAYFTNKTLPKMVHGFRKMHKVGIWVRDIHYKNYRAGILIDFSRAWTMPHPYLKREIMDNERMIPPEESLVVDAIEMDEIIDWWNKEHPQEADKVWVRMLANEDYRWKTRAGRLRAVHDQYPYRPEEYDWQRAEKARGVGSRKKRKTVKNPTKDVMESSKVDRQPREKKPGVKKEEGKTTIDLS